MYYNQSVTEFVVVGFTSLKQYHTFLFTLFLFLYIIITSGNGITFIIIILDHNLHIPMYLYIAALSIVEILIVTTVYPTMLDLFLKGRAFITFDFCLFQMYAFYAFLVTENYILSVMAYDRYVAICNALRYHSIMTIKFCKVLIFLCWLLGFLTPLATITMIYRLPFCGPNEIEHIYCDSCPLLTLACTDSDLNVSMDLNVSTFTIIINSIIIILIYINILVTILKMKTSEDRSKAFSTCMSHLFMSLFFYGSIAYLYLNLHTTYSAEYDLATSLHHAVLTPLLSPLVYSFRNKDIKHFLKKQLKPKTILLLKKSNIALKKTEKI